MTQSEEYVTAEYRLIPVEQSPRGSQVAEYEDELPIDLMGIIRNLWDRRSTILRVAGLVFAIGLFIFAMSERTYYADAKLMPEATTTEGAGGSILQQYSGLIGINSSELGQSELINVDFYPEIVQSKPFLVELIQKEVYFAHHDTTTTIYDYYTNIKTPSFFESVGYFLWDITLGLPDTISRLFSGSSGSNKQVELNFTLEKLKEGPLNLDGTVKKAANEISKVISVYREPQTGFVVISADMADPGASADVVQQIKRLIQQYVIDYRTEKVSTDLKFIESQFQNARKEWQMIRDSLAEFRDKNKNLITAKAQTKEEQLQAEYNLKFELYSQLAKQLEQKRIKVQEQTPVFSTLEPVSIPTSPSYPDPMLFFPVTIILSVFLGVSFIFGVDLWEKFITEFNRK